MGNAELCDIRITSAKDVAKFLQSHLAKLEDGDLRKYFASWSPCRIGRVDVRFIWPSEIYRPVAEKRSVFGMLTGIKGIQIMHHFTADRSIACVKVSQADVKIGGEVGNEESGKFVEVNDLKGYVGKA